MKALSLWQPWASLMAAGRKRCETRSWPILHRGPLLIHAAKKWDADLAFLAAGKPFRAALEQAGIVFETTEEAAKRGWGMPFGVIVGRVDLVACVPTAEVGEMLADSEPCYWPNNPKYFPIQIGPTERAFGDYSAGRFAFLCENPVRFEKPIPFRGMQGLFEVPDELLKELK